MMTEPTPEATEFVSATTEATPDPDNIWDYEHTFDEETQTGDGSHCSQHTLCPWDKPVCNFDYGWSGFCEKCPRHCVNTGYHNPMATEICCQICGHGEAGGCGASDTGSGNEVNYGWY